MELVKTKNLEECLKRFADVHRALNLGDHRCIELLVGHAFKDGILTWESESPKSVKRAGRVTCSTIAA